jgi:hypothetical protein
MHETSAACHSKLIIELFTYRVPDTNARSGRRLFALGGYRTAPRDRLLTSGDYGLQQSELP